VFHALSVIMKTVGIVMTAAFILLLTALLGHVIVFVGTLMIIGVLTFAVLYRPDNNQ